MKPERVGKGSTMVKIQNGKKTATIGGGIYLKYPDRLSPKLARIFGKKKSVGEVCWVGGSRPTGTKTAYLTRCPGRVLPLGVQQLSGISHVGLSFSPGCSISQEKLEGERSEKLYTSGIVVKKG